MKNTKTIKLLQILLVEDSASDAALLQENILLSGATDISISVVQSLNEAKDHLKNNHTDAVLLDLTLPDSSGLETVTRLRNACPDMPIVVLTGVDDVKTGVEAVRTGVQDYLVKGLTDGRLIARAIHYSIERKHIEIELRKARDELEKRVEERTAELSKVNVELTEEITARRRTENRMRITNVLLELFAQKTSRKEYLDSVVNAIGDWSGCRCVGIRLTNSDGYIPFESCTGFSDQFLAQENMLSLDTDACLCIRAITQQKQSQDIPLATPRGSFRSDNTLEFINKLAPKYKSLYRGICMKHGFKSLAVIPIRYRDHILGAIHIADTKANLVPLEKVELLENMAMLIGEAVHRFNVEHSLRSSESRLSEAQRIAHLGNWELEIATGALWWSDEVYRIFGRKTQEFAATYEAFLSCVHPGDRELVKEAVNRALYKDQQYDIDHKVVRPDGSECVVHEHAEVVYDENHNPVRMIGTVLDVTEQKEAEKRILDNQAQLRALAAQLQLVEEQERRRLARDLHDSIGQILAFSTMTLRALQKTSAEQTAQSLEEVSKQLDVAIQQARTLSFNLSPSVLYDFGLEVAVEDLVDTFAKERKIRCGFKNCRMPKPLTDEVKILLYRSVRELLINAAKHADASVVKVSLLRSSSDIYIMVEDDGRGLDVTTLNARSRMSKGFGIFSIRERLNHIGGQLKIESAAGKGTKVTLIAPLNLEEDEKGTTDEYQSHIGR